MTRRLGLFLLVPALVLTMIGVGIAKLRPGGSTQAVAEVGTPVDEPDPLPTLSPPDAADPPSLPPVVRVEETSTPEPAAPAYDVVAVQQQLSGLGYYLGPLDGSLGPGMRSAVMAFQKVHGLGVDGVVGEQTLAALSQPVTPVLQGGPDTRIEVDLTKQVLYYVEAGQLQRIMPVSSGSGQTYRTKSGGKARSLTPVGTYHVQRRIRGIRNADLGTLYDPMYFYKGWAIHGSNSVPAYPASHGCIRVTRSDALWLFDRAPVGMPVIIYGGTHTFPAGSSAPGTDTPAGDTAETARAPAPSPSPEPTDTPPASPPPSESPSSSPSPSPSHSPSPTPSPSPTQSEPPPEGPLP